LATTNTLVQTVQGDANKLIYLRLTAGGADTTVTYTLPTGTKIRGLTAWNETTNAVNPASCTYVASTGVVTVPCANSDVVTVTVFLV
jgi:hypothetical protein